MKRLVIGISGGSGVVYAIRMLEVLKDFDDVETHLVMSPTAKRTVLLETDLEVAAVEALADEVHNFGDLADVLSSGSYKTSGMVVVPCAIKTLSGIANSYGDNLLVRAADVTLKERRRLVLVVRETPLHLGHVRLMAQAAEMGAVLMPPMPAFYDRPKSIDDIVNHTVNRVLDLVDIELSPELFDRWRGA